MTCPLSEAALMLNALHAEFTLAKSSIFLCSGEARGGLYPEIMPVSLADESRRDADECRQQAEIAEYWMKMAQDADPGPEAGSDQ